MATVRKAIQRRVKDRYDEFEGGAVGRWLLFDLNKRSQTLMDNHVSLAILPVVQRGVRESTKP